jgi:primary-amine oxidase
MYTNLAIYAGFFQFVFASAVPPLGYERRVLRDVFDKRAENGTFSCLGGEAVKTTAPRPNPFAPLTKDENFAVWNLLHDPTSGLNLTHPSSAKLTDNYVYVPLRLSCLI